MIDFEFDHAKSLSNLKKHGINFEKAKTIWDDPDCVEVPARLQDELRLLVIGKIEGKLWAAIITYRNNKIRIISVRRARPEEEAVYES
jgi:uncharacterized DUF497 family protein